MAIIAGKHDSPGFLDAPDALLEHLHIHVTGQAGADAAREVLLLRDAAGGMS